jgi:uncharacterized protein YndB with AHSA1/START domain
VTSRILVSLRVAVPPERAFAAFVGEIGAWWRPNALFRFTPGAPGRLAFEPGLGGRLTETVADGETFEIGRITIWQPGARLAFTWRQASFAADQLTRVEVCGSRRSKTGRASASSIGAGRACRRTMPPATAFPTRSFCGGMASGGRRSCGISPRAASWGDQPRRRQPTGFALQVAICRRLPQAFPGHRPPVSATAVLAETADEPVRAVLRHHPDEKQISLLAISASHLERDPELQFELSLGLQDEGRRPGSRHGMARVWKPHCCCYRAGLTRSARRKAQPTLKNRTSR